MSIPQPLPPQEDAHGDARIFKALGDANRVRIVGLLACEGEKSATQIADAMGLSLALVSHHIKVLADAGVVHTRKEGQTRYCRVDERVITGACEKLIGGGG
ncbi:MAG TPA: metalloregulator ArsR/SmtB family transcription factor [Longimicrobiaceae bacterium]|nr:metalloregulator ArsR/SmtB family transcription factor [Longimicrobiaceae bacterium]